MTEETPQVPEPPQVPGLTNEQLEAAAEQMAKTPAWFEKTMKVRTASWHNVLPVVDPMASDLATIDFACMLAAFLAPAVIVEAGTYRGHMALAIANTLIQMGHAAKIYTADPADFGVGKFIVGRKFSHMIEYHNSDYLDMLPKVPGQIDLAFIDASHTDNSHMRLQHTTATFERLAPGGLILIDDIAATDWEDAKLLRESANIYFKPHRGLGLLQKPYTWPLAGLSR